LYFQVQGGADWWLDADNRWYSDAFGPLTPGEHKLEVPLISEQWHNVQGQKNQDRFNSARRQVATVGLAYGDPGAGATMHGVRGDGKFTLLRFIATLEGGKS